MAKKSAHGYVYQTYDCRHTVYSLMSDGVLLLQYRVDGRLEPAKIATRKFKGQVANAMERLYIQDSIHGKVLKIRRTVNG